MRLKKSLVIARHTTPNSTPIDAFAVDFLEFVGPLSIKFGTSTLHNNAHLYVGDSRAVAELDSKTGAMIRKFDFTVNSK